MNPRRLPPFLLAAILLWPGCAVWAQDIQVKVATTITVHNLMEAETKALREAKGIVLLTSTNKTSTDALDDLATYKADIAIITREPTGEDRAKYPGVDLVGTPIGMQVAAIGVSNDVWEAGVHSITAEKMRAIYEQKIKNWKELGGPDEKLTYLNFPEGQGIWEIFAEWLYSDNRRAPNPKVQKVNSSEDARDTLEFNQGTIVPMGASMIDGVRCHALAVDVDGHLVTPTQADLASGAYPMVRPIIAVTVSLPAVIRRTVIDFLTGPEGQALVKKSGAMDSKAVPTPTPNPYY